MNKQIWLLCRESKKARKQTNLFVHFLGESTLRQSYGFIGPLEATIHLLNYELQFD